MTGKLFFHPAGTQSREAIESAQQRLLERYEAFGLELGWSNAAGGDSDQRQQAAIDAARAELVLLEAKAHGAIQYSAPDRQEQLKHLLRQRAADESVCDSATAQGSTLTESAGWRFGWRRTGGFVLLAAIAGFLLAARGHAQWCVLALLASLTALLALGPWQLARQVSAAATGVRRAVGWMAGVCKTARLNQRLAV